MSKPASSLSNFFRELRRRKVFRVSIVYAVVGWLSIKVVCPGEKHSKNRGHGKPYPLF
jgi:hypothetical protein